MTTRLKGSLALGMLVVLGVAGCESNDKAGAEESAPPPVLLGPENIAIVQETTLATGPIISGALAAVREAQVRAETSGPVRETRVESGQRVKAGAMLARLDDTALRDVFLSARAGFRSAEVTMADARRDLERDERLHQAGAVSERALEQSRTSVATAEAALADARSRLVSAQEQLHKTTVRAPFSGVVSERSVSAGDVVQSGALLYTIIDPTNMQLEATVPADQLQSLKVGTPVEFTVSGYGARRFQGRIDRINPAADPATRQVRIYVTIPNRDQGLVAGLFTEGRVESQRKRAPAIPVTALDPRGMSSEVLRLHEARVQRVKVDLGIRDLAAEMVEVTRGLAPGDTVLLGSSQGLVNGTVVRIQREEGSGPVESGNAKGQAKSQASEK
ncbi:MAG TPA: efflux RND transporter periplasmic adaptor subunit [Gemmatimonadales bacterium]|nr:efflux RND transporter periplasmic adaptor subunit [Gemmatimonadales bacterium]